MKKHFYTPKDGEKILLTVNPSADNSKLYNDWLKHITQIERRLKIKEIFGDEFNQQ